MTLGTLGRPLKCMYQADLGGLGIPVDQPLLRVVGSIEELVYLLDGRMSFTKAADFPDALEAFPSIEDVIAHKRFFGPLANSRYANLDTRTDNVRNETHVNCWHQLTKTSDLQRLIDNYSTVDGVEKAFWCVVETLPDRISQAIQDGTDRDPWTVDFGRVRYIHDEGESIMALFGGNTPMATYPQLFCKRANMRWENEARLVMHDWGVATVSPGPRRQRGLPPLPKWLYAAIDPEKLIDSIWFAKAEYAEAVRAHIPELNRRFSVRVMDQIAAIRELMTKATEPVPFPDIVAADTKG